MKLINRIYFFTLFIQKYLILAINDDENNKFNAIYRIDNISKDYPLIINNKDFKVQFSNKKEGKEESFRLIPITNTLNSYYIITMPFNQSVGVNDKGEVVLYKINDDKNAEKTKWNFIKINDKHYLLQNSFNKKYMEIKDKKTGKNIIFYPVCSTDLNKEVENEEFDKISKSFKYSFFKLCEEVKLKPEHLKMIDNEPVDMLIKYIDLSDKNLNRKGITQIKKDEDNEELRYSVRSILQYIPWIRKIFILMPNEKVKYFKPIDEINGKIVYAKDKDLLGFDSANSVVFQLNLYKMKKLGISENFILMDDDYFFGKPIKKSDFFYYDEEQKKVLPSVVTDDFTEMIKNNVLNEYNKLYKRKNSIKPHTFNGWKISQLAAFKLLLENYNPPLINAGFSHNAIPLNLNDLEEIHSLIEKKYEYAKDTLTSKIRTVYDLQPQSLFNSFALNVKKRKVHSIPYVYYDIAFLDGKSYDIEMFVLNTSGDRKYTQAQFNKVQDILKKKYPIPTPFEIETNDAQVKGSTKTVDLNDYIKKSEYDNLKKKFDDLEKNNKELNNKIDKAINEKNEIEKNLKEEINKILGIIKNNETYSKKYENINRTKNVKIKNEDILNNNNQNNIFLKLIIVVLMLIIFITYLYLYSNKKYYLKFKNSEENVSQMTELIGKDKSFMKLSTEDKP